MAQETFIFSPGYEAVQRSLYRAYEGRISEGKYSKSDVENIRNRELDLIRADLEVDNRQLEKLRRLCQLWEVDLSVANITSHRRIIGPIIVKAKKILFPVIRFFLKDLIREQRAFNAEVISLLADLSHDAHRVNKGRDNSQGML